MPQHTTILVSPTGRVRLIPPKPDDDEAAAITRSHPETLRYLRFMPEQVTVEDIRIRRESRAEDPKIVDFHIHVVNADGTTTFAGMSGLFNIDTAHSSTEVGIVVSPAMHRGGYGTEALYTVLKYAFEDRKIHRATFETSAANVPMQSWLQNVLGAKLEAERREAWRENDGNYCNVRSYSILDWEWMDYAKQKLERSMVPRTTNGIAS